MEIKEIALKEKQRLEDELNNLQRLYGQKSFPEGKLSFSKNGASYKFYNTVDKERKYIPAKEKALIKELAQKRYYIEKITACQNEIRALDSYLKKSPKDPDDMIKKHPTLQKILFQSSASDWADTDYEKNKNHPENLIIKTIKGDMVRSKSEAMIADELFRCGVPYRYEPALPIGNDVFYPDFIVKNKRTGKAFVWEHFGKLDDVKYLENNYLYKMNKYARAGFIPSLNFIATYEDSGNPFYPMKATEMIKMYLL